MEARRLCTFYKISLYDHFDLMVWHSNINVYHVKKKKSEKWVIRDSIINTVVNIIWEGHPATNMKPEFKDQPLLYNGAISY